MIGWLSGTVVRKAWPVVIVEAGGVGYELRVPRGTYDALPGAGGGATLEVLTLFRADSLALYGFSSASGRALFESLLGISGVGPRLALAVLSGVSVPVLVDAVRLEDGSALEAVPGIGRKTARRIVLELKDRLGDVISLDDVSSSRDAAVPAGGLPGDAVAALESLGYRRSEAERAVGATVMDESPADLPSLIRGSLRRLGSPS